MSGESTIELSAVLQGVKNKYPQYSDEITKVIDTLNGESFPIQFALLGLSLSNPELSSHVLKNSSNEAGYEIEDQLPVLLDGVYAILAFSLTMPSARDAALNLLKNAADSTKNSVEVSVTSRPISRKKADGTLEVETLLTLTLGQKTYDINVGSSGEVILSNLNILSKNIGQWVCAKDLHPNDESRPFIYDPDSITTEAMQREKYRVDNKTAIQAFLSAVNIYFVRADLPLTIESLKLDGANAVCYRLMTTTDFLPTNDPLQLEHAVLTPN